MKRIYISGDHAGFYLKDKIVRYLEKLGYKVEDFGPYEYNKNDDYPDYTFPLAEKVSKNRDSYGVVIAGSGIGECIAANKVKGIRAVLYHGGNKKILKISREHDNSNILCFGSRLVSEKEAKEAVKLWLKTKFTGEKRHKRRLGKIERFEKKG